MIPAIAPRLMENGWISDQQYDVNPFLVLFCVSATPIFRILFIITAMYMATHTKEEFDAWQQKLEDDEIHFDDEYEYSEDEDE
jgi:hypothetical protein